MSHFDKPFPLWVKSRHLQCKMSCPLTPKADMCGATSDVRFVPIADIVVGLRHVRFTAPKADLAGRYSGHRRAR